MRCPRCGNENPEGNRFCGMCGATMLAADVPAAQAQRAAASGSSPSAPAPPLRPRSPEPLRPAPPSDDRPSISGPSFLGLSDPAPRKRGTGLSIDPHASSGNLDYLLDDEEEHRGSGAGKVFLILIALALAVGFGYLRWKGHGFGWLSSISNKPSAVAKNPESTDSDSSSAPSGAAADSPTPAANQPPSGTAPASAPAKSTPAADTQGTNSAPAPSSSAPPSSAPSSSVPANKPVPKSDEASAAPNANNTADDNAPDSDSENTDSTSTADKPAAAAEPPAPKPRPASKPVQRTDAVAEAQKYLYGRGAAQDCERGLRLLKPAANAANPKAMVEMGALYSAGLCTPHDLPTAYRWFAMALRKDPENQAIQGDLQKLWGEMTQPERQLAIKLTQ